MAATVRLHAALFDGTSSPATTTDVSGLRRGNRGSMMDWAGAGTTAAFRLADLEAVDVARGLARGAIASPSYGLRRVSAASGDAQGSRRISLQAATLEASQRQTRCWDTQRTRSKNPRQTTERTAKEKNGYLRAAGIAREPSCGAIIAIAAERVDSRRVACSSRISISGDRHAPQPPRGRSYHRRLR